VRPEVQVAGYDGLRVTIDRPEVDEAEVDAQIDRMREVQATLAEVDRPAIDGDVLTIDITGSLDGESQEGLTADDYSYTVGGGTITPEVDQQLPGAKVGDILQFEATHPDPDESRQLEFRVLVKQVSERVLPEADDTWAAEASEFDTIDELRESIRERMALVGKAQAQAQLRERATEALAELVPDDPPDTLIEHQSQHQLQDLALRLRAQGMDLEQWLASSGRDPAELQADLRKDAAQSVKVDLALRAVAEAEQIECSDDDLEGEIQQLATRLKEKPSRVRAQFERGGQLLAVRSDIRKRKAFDWLLERVEVVDQDGAPLDRADLELDTTPPTDEADAATDRTSSQAAADDAQPDDVTDIADDADTETETE
jgi:trigger factor